MSDSLIHTIYLAGAFLVLFASAELLYHKLKFKAEVTRKYVHIATGLMTMLFPPLIGNHWFVLALCGSFLLILLASLRFGLLPSINAVDRVTRGSILFPIIVYGCYLLFDHYGDYSFYYIPILTLTICDPMAAFVGKNWPQGRYTIFGKSKTLSGSMGFFAAAAITSFTLISGLNDADLKTTLMATFTIAVTTTLAEAVAHKGYDNLSIPATAVLVLIAFHEMGFAL